MKEYFAAQGIECPADANPAEVSENESGYISPLASSIV